MRLPVPRVSRVPDLGSRHDDPTTARAAERNGPVPGPGDPAPHRSGAEAYPVAGSQDAGDNQGMRQPETRPRKPASETRELLLGVAVQRVQSEGLLLDFANIELEN